MARAGAEGWYSAQMTDGSTYPAGPRNGKAVGVLEQRGFGWNRSAGAAQPPSEALTGPASPGRSVCAPGAMAFSW